MAARVGRAEGHVGLPRDELRRRLRRRRRRGRVAEPGVAAPQRAERADDDLLERLPRGAGARGPRLRLLLEQRAHPRLERRVGPRRQRRHRLADVVHHHRQRVALDPERDLAGQQLEGDHAGLVEVRPRTHLGRHRLLGRHVGGRADRRAGRREHLLGDDLLVGLGDPEVRDLHAAVRGHEQVLGLDVAVDDPLGLRVRERGEQAVEHAHHLRQGQRADERPQRAALEVLHRDVRRPLPWMKSKTVTTLGWLSEPGHARLADEPLRERFVRGVERRELLRAPRLRLNAGWRAR